MEDKEYMLVNSRKRLPNCPNFALLYYSRQECNQSCAAITGFLVELRKEGNISVIYEEWSAANPLPMSQHMAIGQHPLAKPLAQLMSHNQP
ncbi:hypothetical protein TSMEX_007500 [Taenia solium]|eukprot:TsM_000734600 transcript=TsM_000734600 gene=TsM_000734600